MQRTSRMGKLWLGSTALRVGGKLKTKPVINSAMIFFFDFSSGAKSWNSGKCPLSTMRLMADFADLLDWFSK